MGLISRVSSRTYRPTMSGLPYPNQNNLPYPTGNVPGIPQIPIAGEMPGAPGEFPNQPMQPPTHSQSMRNPSHSSSYNQPYGQNYPSQQLSYRQSASQRVSTDNNYLPGQSPQNFSTGSSAPISGPPPSYSAATQAYNAQSYGSQKMPLKINKSAGYPSHNMGNVSTDPYRAHDNPYPEPYYNNYSSEKKKQKTVKVPVVGKVKKKNLYKGAGALAAGMVLKNIFD